MYSFVSFKFYTSANKVYSFGCRVVLAECMPAADIRFLNYENSCGRQVL